MFFENVYTLEEVAQHLRVPVDAVRQEITSGRLQAYDVAGFVRIGESALNTYKGKAKAVRVTDTCEGVAKDESWLQLREAPDFRYKWPDEKDEEFTDVHEGVASYNGRSYHVKLGFTDRRAAGKLRRRCLVQIDRYATVEFVAAEEQISDTAQLASIIKDRNGKQLPVGAALPPEYESLPVGPYRSVVDGPGASNGLAVVCQASDFETMVKHALIRYVYRAERE